MLLAKTDLPRDNAHFHTEHNHFYQWHLEFCRASEASDFDRKARFLPHFTRQRCGEILTIVQLAARPFPLAGTMCGVVGPANEKAPILVVGDNGFYSKLVGLIHERTIEF